jgi:hypothetical protein
MTAARRRLLAVAITAVAAGASLASLDEAAPETSYASPPTGLQTTVLSAPSAPAVPPVMRAIQAVSEGPGATQLTVAVQGTVRWSGPSDALAADAGTYGDLSAVVVSLGPHGADAVQARVAPRLRPGGALQVSASVPCAEGAARCAADLDLGFSLLEAPPGAEVTISWSATATVAESLGAPSPSSVTISLGP